LGLSYSFLNEIVMNIHIGSKTRLASVETMAAELKVKTSTRDLTTVLVISFSFVEEVVGKCVKSDGTKELTKGYKYFSEKYVTDIRVKDAISAYTVIHTVLVLSVSHDNINKPRLFPHSNLLYNYAFKLKLTVYALDGYEGCLIRARCYRSQKKNESPHDVEVVIKKGPVFGREDSKCSCAVGRSGCCGHIVGVLYSIAHMKASNLKAVPTDVAKTSLPQTWHVPR
ncbi:uncharacterized protein LOC134265275, partial [Saccostrea cucullata]|uniref:uncharacterized protein LOC134265275 n=1 Tax=Saccostrea cuccullata TaxID=36930 RepID=UPI002ED0289D